MRGKGESVGTFFCATCYAVRSARAAAGDNLVCRACEQEACSYRWIKRTRLDGDVRRRTSTTAHRLARDNKKCQIDSISQSWCVVRRSDSERSRRAMDAVLLDWCGTARADSLLDPPFDKSVSIPYSAATCPRARKRRPINAFASDGMHRCTGHAAAPGN